MSKKVKFKKSVKFYEFCSSKNDNSLETLISFMCVH